MSSAIKASARHWLFGIILAAIGVTLSRVVAPEFDAHTKALLATAGQLIALSGLFVILLGIRKRLHRANADAPPVG